MADKYYFAPLKPGEPQEGMGLYRHGTGACIYYSERRRVAPRSCAPTGTLKSRRRHPTSVIGGKADMARTCQYVR